MLSIKTNKGYIPLENRQNLSIKTEYGGNRTLSFDISTKDKAYKYIQNQSLLKYGDNEYLVDSINQRKVITSVSASINMDDWKVRFHHTWDSTYDLFADVLLKITPQGWILDDAGTVIGKKALHLEGVTDYEILMKCKSLYNIAFEFHTAEKRIKVIKPNTFQSRGLYATDELNATNVEYKGASTTFATRLYAYGKKEEVKDESGNVTSTSCVTFANINGGKEYVENFTYSNKIITAYWSDERYTSPEDLLVDTKEKLKVLATPVSSYGFELVDLSRINEKYKMLDFQMYDKISLISNGERIEHQIVEYTEYPDNSNNNKVVLSSAFKKITGKIEGISQQITDIDIDLNIKENIINEVRRDVESNTARINNTYTKGEVDHIEESIIQQTSESIRMAVSSVEESIEKIDISNTLLTMYKSGTLISEEIPTVTLKAMLTQNSKDVTDATNASYFKWIRISNNDASDTTWNSAHKGMKSISLNSTDVDLSASFQCVVNLPEITRETGFETIVDETDVLNLSLQFTANKTVQQLLNPNDNSIYPEWNPLIITPIIQNGMQEVPLSEVDISWKRKGGALVSGELVKGGTLEVTGNKMVTENKKTITYVCEASYKERTLSNELSFILVNDGYDGSIGADATERYTWIRYADTPTTGMSDEPTNKKYMGIAYNKTSTTESSNYSDYAWSLIKGDKGDKGDQGIRGLQGIQGVKGDQGIAGVKGADGKTSYTHIAYANSADGKLDFSVSDSNRDYVGMYVDFTATDSTVYTTYAWSKIKGADGAQGIAGQKGADGRTPYLHIAYATNATGTTGFSTTDSLNKTHMGQYTDFVSADSTTPSKYAWSLIKGDKGATGEQGAQGDIGATLSNGRCLYLDPTFTKGLNGIVRYNNSSNTNVTVSRVTSGEDCPSNSAMMVEIKNIGTASPGIGGFYFGTTSRANAVFIYRIIAKIPSGRKLLFASNSAGTGYTSKWLTTNGSKGTGKFEEYLLQINCGATGSFSTTGFFYIDGSVGTTSAPVTWYLAYATCFDMTDVPLLDIEGALNEQEQRITTTYKAEIETKSKEIGLTVQSLTEKVGESSEEITGLKNQIKLTDQETSFIKTTINKLTDIVDGKMSSSEIQEWARFNGAQLELGASNSPFKTILSTTELAFFQGSTKVAWISNNELHIANSVIMSILRIGNWQWQDEGSAGLTLRKV